MGIQLQALTTENGFSNHPQGQIAGRRAVENTGAGVRQAAAALPGGGVPGADGESGNSASDLNRTASLFGRRLLFEVDHESQDVTIKIIDRQTDRVIRVLPPEELQRLHRGIREALGSLVDQSV